MRSSGVNFKLPLGSEIIVVDLRFALNYTCWICCLLLTLPHSARWWDRSIDICMLSVSSSESPKGNAVNTDSKPCEIENWDRNPLNANVIFFFNMKRFFFFFRRATMLSKKWLQPLVLHWVTLCRCCQLLLIRSWGICFYTPLPSFWAL